VARNVQPIPSLAHQKELPAGRIRHLDNQPALRAQQAARAFEITGEIVKMLEHMEHGDGGAARIEKGRARKRCADRGDVRAGPSGVSGVERKIESCDRAWVPLGEHLQEQASAAADIQNQSLFFGFTQGALDETKMIAQNQSAVALFETIGCAGLGHKPVVFGIVIAEFERRGLRIQANQSAIAALNDAEFLAGGAIQAVRRGVKQPRFEALAGGASLAVASRQADSWEICLREIRCWSSRRRNWRDVKRRVSERRFHSIFGIPLSDVMVPHSRAVAALSRPTVPG